MTITSERDANKRDPRARNRLTTVTTDGKEAPKQKSYLVESENSCEIVFADNAPEDDTRTWIRILNMQVLNQKDGEFYAVLEDVRTRTIPTQYAIAVICDLDFNLISATDGKAQRFIIRSGYKKSDGTVSRPAVIWEGHINVQETYLAYEVTSGRTLKPLEWSRYIQIETINSGGHIRNDEIPAMDFRQQQARSAYISKLGLDAAFAISDIVKYIRIRLNTMGDSGMSVSGQGPVRLDVATHVFCAQSVSFDNLGQIHPEIKVDVSAISEHLRYYDVTPPDKLDSDTVKNGCRQLLKAYDEIPEMPETPAAFLGSLFTGPLATIEPRLFVALFLSGLHGSGKTRMARRYDAIQTRNRGRKPGDLDKMKPVINVGDRTGTSKGTKYRVEAFGGFVVTCDDVLKKDDSQAQINNAVEFVSNLLRSYESGGAALGKVDRAKNRVISGEAGTLQSNVKFTSEIPIPGASTNERMIVLPHLSTAWDGGIFDCALSRELATPESIESQHQAWSAYAMWIFTRINTVVADAYEKASEITKLWSVSSRTKERYTAVIAGNYMFEAFCAEQGIDASAQVTRAVESLQRCAINQTQSTVSLADMFRMRLRQMLTDKKVCFMGRPIMGPDGIVDNEYSQPFTIREVVKDGDDNDGEPIIVRELPTNVKSIEDLGVVNHQNRIIPAPNAHVRGYVIPPRGNSGKETPLKDKWVVAIPTLKFKNLCDQLTDYSRLRDGQAFRPDDVISALAQERRGGKIRLYISSSDDPDIRKTIKPDRVVQIDCEWLFAPIEDDSAEESE